jgi:L-galactono-1,4-lactone dehydrogenase
LKPDDDVAVANWSGTHSVTARKVFSPEGMTELQELIAWASRTRQKLRPLGSSLSPNGLALQKDGMLSMAQLDQVVSVDTKGGTITVQAGARVSTILEELAKHGLTLENFSSVTEQQIGGWTQVGAHGTGARIPTVDEMVTRLKVVTPGCGTMELGADGEQDGLFRWIRCGLGALGVVSEVTLKCVPRYTLHEKTYCTTVAELRRSHKELLQKYRHVRYMWIPYTDTVVVVVSDVAQPGAKAKPAIPEEQRVEPLKSLIRQLRPDCGDLGGQNFAQLREQLLALDPLDPEHVAKVNQAEAEFWRLSEGERIGDSTAILGFECGGVQWVLENCFPCGTISNPSLADIDYVVEIKETIERERIAAASPIEQRWTSRSSSPMSPAYSPDEGAIFSWVGVIMYITDEQRAPAIKDAFRSYAEKHADQTFKYRGTFHWAKVDLNFHKGRRQSELSECMRRRFDLQEFNVLRKKLDPENILGNTLIDEVCKV